MMPYRERTILSYVHTLQAKYEPAVTAAERAIALDPNNADSYAWQADVLNLAGRPEDARGRVEQAMRLNPRYPPFY
jgi:Flp pilus assembly protein TadD